MAKVRCSECSQLSLESKIYCFYFDKEIKNIYKERVCRGFTKK